MANSGQFQKGNPGKKKGTPNKLSKSVKDTVLEVFNKMQEDGGPSALINWAQEEPTEFYRIAAKLIPTDIRADVKTVQKISLQIVRTIPNPRTSDASPQPAESTE